jgi:hypothetical protein
MNHNHPGFEVWHPNAARDRAVVLEELHRVLVSSHFCNSKRYPALLQYVVEKTLAGESESLKERTIAVEVFGRPHTYDPGADTVVRYTAGEVRRRLLLYYSEQSESQLRIFLQPGSYVPEFLHNDEAVEQKQTQSKFRSKTTGNSVNHPHTAVAADRLNARMTSDGDGTATAPEFARHSGPRSHWLLWTAAALVLLLIAAAGWWKYQSSRPESALRGFWAPVLRGHSSVLLCTGGVVFKQNNYSGVTTASRDADYTFTSMQTSSAIALIGDTTVRLGSSIEVIPSATTALTDLRDHSVILLGAYNTDWTLRLLQTLPIHFSARPDEVIIDASNPGVRWARNQSLPYSSADDYALVARFWEPTTGGWVVALAGLGRNGTEAATQFATSPHYMQLLRQQAGRDFRSRNIEAVLKVTVIDGKTGAPSLLTVRMW